jgi:hypothetical protein
MKLRGEAMKALDYFTAGMPAHSYFELEVSGLKKLVQEFDLHTGLNQSAEVCVIALAAYFEAFCKAQFAAVINIYPKIVRNFVEKRKSVNLDLRNFLTMMYGGDSFVVFDHRLGYLLSEDYDFGSAKDINLLYYDLLRITPFSGSEKKKYEKFLNDRNLLVHHGGIHTFKYLNQQFRARTAPGLPHWTSLVVTRQDFDGWAAFLERMAHKIASTSRQALEEFAEGFFTPEQSKALDYLSEKPHKPLRS